MIKSWLDLWKNIFNYKGKTKRKHFWLAIITNVFAMYIFMIPYALILRNFPVDSIIASVVFIVIMTVPVLAIYFRRANDACLRLGTTIYIALVAPIISGLFVGILPTDYSTNKEKALIGKAFALSYGLFFYGGVLGFVFYGDPTAIPGLPAAGLLLGALTLIVYGIRHPKEVLAFFNGGL